MPKCRETLKELTSMTYNVENVSALKELYSSLKGLRETFISLQPTDEMESKFTPNLKHRQREEQKIKNDTKKKYLPLPQRPRKNKFNNRIG